MGDEERWLVLCSDGVDVMGVKEIEEVVRDGERDGKQRGRHQPRAGRPRHTTQESETTSPSSLVNLHPHVTHQSAKTGQSRQRRTPAPPCRRCMHRACHPLHRRGQQSGRGHHRLRTAARLAAQAAAAERQSQRRHAGSALGSAQQRRPVHRHRLA